MKPSIAGAGTAEVFIKRVCIKVQLPTRATPGSAGWDLYSPIAMTIQPRETRSIALGFALAIPEGFEGQVRSRSGHAHRGLVVANSPGTIDSDYRGEVGVILFNRGPLAQYIRIGERIAQLVIQRVLAVRFVEVDALNETERGIGGFGSTGD